MTLNEFGPESSEANDARSKLIEYRKLVGSLRTHDTSLLKVRLCFQHDSLYMAPDSGNGPSHHPNEIFFIDRLGTSLEKTGAKLRKLEDNAFR